MFLNDDLAELIQHEYDHLDGILAVQRAIDQYSFAIKEQAR
jgi:peptide deformylase